MGRTTGLHPKVFTHSETAHLSWKPDSEFLTNVFITEMFCVSPTCSPSGHVDPGEDDLTTALRETQEEAGLRAEHLRVIDSFVQELHYEVRGRPKEVLYWLAELRDPGAAVTLSDEHQDYRWARLEEACSLAQYKDLQDTLRAAHTHLQTQGDKL
ncbi:bis5' [Solea senegalensis]|uniref:bis(5'-nucleosyl)-tetraphosphatase (asymmetrical) n=1 Tax=Solea senegalensis TaxID=28829 RepID=A0AAV6QN57_SOLSE|nr:bis5' [Solea senegalensis]